MKINIILILICILPIAISCKGKKENINKPLKVMDPYFGIHPVDTPQILAPNFISSPVGEYNGTFSPDGKEFYYTTIIPTKTNVITFTELLEDNTWSEPKVASFSGSDIYSDFDPLFSPDGSKLYFSSKRTLLGNMNSHIWYVERINGVWGKPHYVSLLGPDENEFYSSITGDGDIYFNMWSTGKIYKAKKTDTTYVVEELPEIINAGFSKGDVFISPDEDYLIFAGYRDDSYGNADLYISFNINSKWIEPENLGKPINSSKQEMCPSVTSDGKIFIFSSNRILNDISKQSQERVNKIHEKYQSYNNGELNIYYMSAGFIENLRKNKNLK